MPDWVERLRRMRLEIVGLLVQVEEMEAEWLRLDAGVPLLRPEPLPLPFDLEDEEGTGFEILAGEVEETPRTQLHVLRPGLFLTSEGMCCGPCQLCGKTWKNVTSVPYEICPGKPP